MNDTRQDIIGILLVSTFLFTIFMAVFSVALKLEDTRVDIKQSQMLRYSEVQTAID
jgi:uncharacterized membrane protein